MRGTRLVYDGSRPAVDAGPGARHDETMSEDRTARSVVVRGEVQGVFFRDATRREADEAGVTGWVGNESDGTVHAHFEGPPDAVQRLVDYVHEGPARACVERVDVTETPPEGLTEFRVR